MTTMLILISFRSALTKFPVKQHCHEIQSAPINPKFIYVVVVSISLWFISEEILDTVSPWRRRRELLAFLGGFGVMFFFILAISTAAPFADGGKRVFKKVRHSPLPGDRGCDIIQSDALVLLLHGVSPSALGQNFQERLHSTCDYPNGLATHLTNVSIQLYDSLQSSQRKQRHICI